MNEIDVLIKLKSINHHLNKGNLSDIHEAIKSTKNIRKINANPTTIRAIKIIKSEMQSLTREDLDLFILFGSFYFKNIFSVFDSEWHYKVNKEIKHFKQLKASPAKYFYMTLNSLIGTTDFDEFMKRFIINNELFKMFMRGDCSVTYLLLFDYFFDLDKLHLKNKIAQDYWKDYKKKYVALKDLLKINDKNLKLKSLKEKILSNDGESVKIEEFKLALKRYSSVNTSNNSKSFLNKLKNKNKKISEIGLT
jgi:hypothetical protein